MDKKTLPGATPPAASCACRRLKVLITLPIKGCVHCHCQGCRSVHGAAFVSWVSTARAGIRISGREHLKWYRPSKTTWRGFCANCGTHLLYLEATRWPGDVHIPRACIFNDVDVVPRAHVFFDRRAAWCSCEDSLPRLGKAGGTEPLADGRGSMAGAQADAAGRAGGDS
jgi:hypothetical protein